MKYDHTVKYGGVYYAAGEDVPCEDDEASKAKKPKNTTDK